MATALNPLASSTSTPTSPASSGLAAAPSQQMFLELLVAQIKNQDPLSPADPTQFTSQLAQFSELEQVIAIRGDIENAQSAASAAPPASTPPPASSPAPTQS
jgi:flagellar basal-body rod modification protein FlgD